MVKVIYSDDSLMVFDKPPGLVVTSSETSKETTLEDILKDEYKINLDRGGIVHRLDKDTSGLIVVAKTLQALEDLQSQFKSRTINKEYQALVHGFVKEPGRVEGAIGRNPGNREKFVVFEDFEEDANVRESVTDYQPLQQLRLGEDQLLEIFPDYSKIQMRKIHNSHYPEFTLLSCHPLTGRTHQIRVHLKHIGFPIVGDEKYAGRKTARLDRRWCKRQFLHAARLEFKHPQSGETMKFESQLPEDLTQALKLLEKI
jgi:23S rRNA pseudouridine1911/1915/1917 synthase